ncbi:hypothetical protein R3P38DRAFT_2566034 [Favolaschia claudopus]|uniref:Uncharacterized protein n=1 Tax=Favolaschia claudopus TaxID=2862362 RepID=A0AAV9ZZ71_9AGAR
MTNQGRLATLFEWIYHVLRSPYTIPTILAHYGLILVYLLVSVNSTDLKTPSHLPLGVAKRDLYRIITAQVRYHDLPLAPTSFHPDNLLGQLQGWVREEKNQNVPTTSPSQRKPTSSLPIPTPTADPAERNLAPAPVHQSTPLPLPQAIASVPYRPTEEAPLSTFPLPSWDGFPNGRIRCYFTPQQIEDTSQLAIYWVGDKLPGKQGSPTAATPGKGKVSHFKCAGVIECESKVCITQIAPGADISRQVQSGCICGFKLHHRSCKLEWSTIRYRGGAVFECNHTHSHSRYTHSLSTPKSKPPQLQSFILRQPMSLISSACGNAPLANPHPTSRY